MRDKLVDRVVKMIAPFGATLMGSRSWVDKAGNYQITIAGTPDVPWMPILDYLEENLPEKPEVVSQDNHVHPEIPDWLTQEFVHAKEEFIRSNHPRQGEDIDQWCRQRIAQGSRYYAKYLTRWEIRLRLPAEHGPQAPPDVMEKIQALLRPFETLRDDEPHWADGILVSGRNRGHWRGGMESSRRGQAPRSDSKLYRVGEEVLPGNTSPGGKFKWWFITSYRSPGDMGMFRLYRSDGNLTSTARVRKVLE